MNDLVFIVFSTHREGDEGPETDILLEGEFTTRKEAEEFQKTLNAQTWIEEHCQDHCINCDGFGKRAIQDMRREAS